MKTISALLTTVFLTVAIDLSAQNVLYVNGPAMLSLQQGGLVYVNGGAQLDNSSTLVNYGSIFLSRTKERSADFTDNSVNPYHYGSGKIIFSGNGIQQLRSINQFGRIEVDNEGLNLLSNIRSDSWFLNSGRINTGSFYAIAASTSDHAIEPGATNPDFTRSWFNGNLRRYITAGAVNSYKFPVGNASMVYMCELDNLLRKPLKGLNYVDANFSSWVNDKTVVDQNENGRKYTTITNNGVWHLLPDINPTSGAFDLKLYLNSFSGLADNSFSILNNTGNKTWLLPPGSVLPADGSAGRTAAAGYAQRNNISSFNHFAIGTSDPLTDASASSLTVYPDPVTNNEFFIRTKNLHIDDIKLFAADNKEIKISGILLLKNDVVKITLPSTLARGMYTIRTNTDAGIRINKIILQ